MLEDLRRGGPDHYSASVSDEEVDAHAEGSASYSSRDLEGALFIVSFFRAFHAGSL